MPARQPTRLNVPRRVGIAALVGLSLLVVSACGQQEATKYGAAVQKAFVNACDGTTGANASSGTGSSSGTATAPSAATCRCVYDRLVKNVSFPDFKKANDSLQKNPNQTLPAVIAKEADACLKAPASSSTTSTPTSAATSSS